MFIKPVILKKYYLLQDIKIRYLYISDIYVFDLVLVFLSTACKIKQMQAYLLHIR